VKPLGPIPSGFETIDGELAVGGHKASELAGGAGGTPLFIYSAELIRRRVAELRAAMPTRLRIHYAVKANPFGPVLELLRGLTDGFDIASLGELEMVLAAGQDPRLSSFAGPGKRDDELAVAIRLGVTINLESDGEARRALAIGDTLGVTPRLAVRVNPAFELRGSGMKMGGGARPFGVDAERVPALAREVIAAGAEWRGLHVFAGSQALDAEAVAETQGNVLDLAARLTGAIGVPLPHLNMGGGFGIPYFHGDAPLDVTAVGGALADRFARLPAELAGTEFAIELGRYLVGEAGVYLARIVDRKESHGQVFLVVDGGLHHQLAASGNFGTVVRRNYPAAIATRFGTEPDEEASIVGCLCTPLDRLADQAPLPRAAAGDLVAIFCAGAYGATASPAAFLGHGPAREIVI
jgi:diaminopimelate decarboxylase